jgi:hypothetical protein
MRNSRITWSLGIGIATTLLAGGFILFVGSNRTEARPQSGVPTVGTGEIGGGDQLEGAGSWCLGNRGNDRSADQTP